MCPHTTAYTQPPPRAPSHSTTTATTPIYHMCPHTAIYVPSYYNTCVLVLLNIWCPHTTYSIGSR
jgi:hypothetical protein